MSTRREFLRLLGLGTAGVYAPVWGRWHRQGSGLLVPEPGLWRVALLDAAGQEIAGSESALTRVQDLVWTGLPPGTLVRGYVLRRPGVPEVRSALATTAIRVRDTLSLHFRDPE